jgi:two-component system sensor histidine kinase ChiS
MRIDFGPRVVLLVGDNPIEQESVQGHLVAGGFRVQIARDYKAAIGALGSFCPDLVCLNLMLPAESGHELCEFMRANRRLAFVPILVMSDWGSPEEMAHAENVGANAFLKKPFSRDKLLTYACALLDGPHSSRPAIRRLRRSDPP